MVSVKDVTKQSCAIKAQVMLLTIVVLKIIAYTFQQALINET